MKKYINILALIVFIVSIWTVNTFISTTIDSVTSNIENSRKDLVFKQSFAEQSDVSSLSKSIDSLVPEKLDKGLLIDLVAKFASESFVEIKSLDIQAVERKINNSSIDTSKKNNNSPIESNNISINTLKEININIDVQGNKQAIYNFCSKLSQSDQYMNILSIDLTPVANSNSQLNTSANNIMSAKISISTYYKKL